METVFQGHTKIALTVKLGYETSLAQFSCSFSKVIDIILASSSFNFFLNYNFPPALSSPSLITLPCRTQTLITSLKDIEEVDTNARDEVFIGAGSGEN